jgi:hypothetical protein
VTVELMQSSIDDHEIVEIVTRDCARSFGIRETTQIALLFDVPLSAHD